MIPAPLPPPLLAHLSPFFQIYKYFHPAYTPPSSKFIPAINDRYVSPILFVNFKTPQSNLLQTQPLQTCDNIWTSISRQPLEPPAVSRVGTPGPPGTLVRGRGVGGGVSCGASSPVIWTTTAGAHLSVSFRLLLIDDGKYSTLGESLLNAIPYDPQKVGGDM